MAKKKSPYTRKHLIYTKGVTFIITRQQQHEALVMRHGANVQEKLDKASVAICGLGGLGSNVAIALARCGVGKLHLIDFDEVDITNLNRQQYDMKYVGVLKTEALKEEIQRFAPYIEITTDNVKITEENVLELLKEEYICEAFDKPEQKAMLTNVVLEKLPDKVLVGASGMAGFGDSNSILTKKRMKNYYICGDGVSDISNTNGLMAPRVMLCAAHQANKIIELIIGEEK